MTNNYMGGMPLSKVGNAHEPMDMDMADPEDEEEIPSLDEVNLDLETYISHYHGIARVMRLEFIADHCKSLRVEALQMATDYLKENTYNYKDYQRLFKKLKDAVEERGGNPDEYQCDMAWVDTKTKQAGLRQERLEIDLKNFRTNSMKENIRRGQDDLGDHYMDLGELENAVNAYSRSRDFALTDRARVNYFLNMIRVSVLLKRWTNVSSNVIKAENAPSLSEDGRSTSPSVTTKLHCAAGLIELNSRRYKRAAKHFLSTNFDQFNQNSASGGNSATATGPVAGTSASYQGSRGSLPMMPSSSSVVASSGANASSFIGTFSSSNFDRDIPTSGSQWDILAPINIAVYGSLCALATYSRQELANQLINSASFKQFAELEPQLREAVGKFYESKYASCLSLLKEMKNVLLLDMYLAPHVERLYKMIRNKALLQYFEPYSTVSMQRMAEALNTNVNDLEKEIIALIYDGSMKARIDSHNKILYAKMADSRTATFERAIKMGNMWQRQVRALISRMAIMTLLPETQNLAGSSR